MTNKEAFYEISNRYDIECTLCNNQINLYHKNYSGYIHFNEFIQKFEFGSLWNSKKMVWSTGEFARHDKYYLKELFNIFDSYFPIRREISLL